MGGRHKKRGDNAVELAGPMPAARRAALSDEARFALDQKRYLRHLKYILTLPEDHPDRVAAADVARERMISAGILDTDGQLTEFYREQPGGGDAPFPVDRP
ncbi:MAG: hypothetical protein LBC26_04700 [Oscillospiraceae bacterium]|jgi:hypothetical protein|nr:hypothetical protein [Oscillospiraceae bacterium]